MVDAMVSDLVDQLVSIIAQQAKEEIKLIVGVDEEVQELKHKLRIIQAVLDDAEEGQVKQHVVKHWLAQLKDAYYEMDDVLDSWNTARIKSEIEKEEGKSADSNATPAVKKRKVCSFLSSSSRYVRQKCNLALRRDIGHKIKKLNETLDKIVKDKVFGFDLTRQLEVVSVDRPKTTAFVDASNIIGRDNNKANLLSSLLDTGSQEERKPRVISLVGMGGLGKTTLAQLAYNDPRVMAHFEQRMWVCVSDPFDQCRVAKAIYQELPPKEPDKNITELQTLLREICDMIRDKKFLIVLDDVWTEDFTKWEPFKLVFENGAQGSRILITTRNNRVAKMMGSSHMINLDVLPNEECWLIFSKIAFSNEDQLQYLEDLGRQLANKCKGLPLAAKTLGSLMHNKTSREQWRDIVDSSLWELEDVERGVFAPLYLSYYDLPSPMKRCFSYCATFPKDYIFYKNELVVLWMAQGYIDSKEKNMEMKAEEYFEVLAMRSFFQDFGKDENDDVSEAENAQLKKKIYLRHLILRFGLFTEDERDERMKNDVLTLNALEPHPDLEILGIVCYLGTTVYPNWMMSLTKLKILTLRVFPKLESLPPLGKLPSLERLRISYTGSLKKVGVEFLGIESKNKKDDIIFPRLKSLLFGLTTLEEWIGFEGMREDEDNGITIIMPRLQQLQIHRCKDLKSLPDFLRTTPLLKELEINDCPILSKRCERGIGEEWPKISHIPNIKIDWKYVQRDGLTPSD
uniref:AAA+ ATPase domain-containing protein n=1 Tax=Fagus sylvatica TaxID=28930 RepID=A0A2N9HBS1_FAGSY